MDIVTEILMHFIGLISIGILLVFGLVVLALHFHKDDYLFGDDRHERNRR